MCGQVGQNKEFIPLLPWLGRCSAIPGRSSTHHKDLGRQTASLPVSLCSCSFPWLPVLSTVPYGLGYPWGQLGSPVPSRDLEHPQPTGWRHMGAAESALVLCKGSSAGMSPCYQHSFGHKSRTQPCSGCSEENELCPSQEHSATESKFLKMICSYLNS